VKAGRELDALVAEKVMGWRRVNLSCMDSTIDGWLPPILGQGVDPPHYSTNIAATWEVVEKMKDMRPEVSFDGARWTVIFWGAIHLNAIRSDSPSHAVCLAALKCVGAT